VGEAEAEAVAVQGDGEGEATLAREAGAEAVAADRFPV